MRSPRGPRSSPSWRPHIATVMSHLGPMAPLLLTLAVTVKAITMAMTLYNAVMAVASVVQGVYAAATGAGTTAIRRNTIALAAYKTAQLVGSIATGIATAATTAFGIALAIATSPITWIIVAIGALVAGLVLFFTKTEIGRKIWTTAWNSIKMAVGVVWSWLQQTVWPALMTALRAVGAVVMWLWRNVITPAFNAIKWVISVAWNAAKLYFGLWVGLFRNVVGPVVMWLWNTVIGPAMRGIGGVIGWVWNTLIKPAWDSFRRSLDILGEAFKFLWNNVIKPTWDALGAGIRWVVDNIITPRVGCPQVRTERRRRILRHHRHRDRQRLGQDQELRREADQLRPRHRLEQGPAARVEHNRRIPPPGSTR